MNPYSHLVIAAQLENDLRPTDLAGYYWGAIAPDVRYAAHAPRAQTHLEPETVLAFLAQYPHLESFIQGYLVHILTDLFEQQDWLKKRHFPRPLRHRISHHLMAVMIETWFIEKSPLRVQVEEQSNEIFRALGISDDKPVQFGHFMNQFLAQPSFAAEIEFVRTFGQNLRLERYIAAMRSLEKYAFLKPIFFRLLDMEGLNRQVLAEIRQSEAFRQLKQTVL